MRMLPFRFLSESSHTIVFGPNFVDVLVYRTIFLDKTARVSSYDRLGVPTLTAMEVLRIQQSSDRLHDSYFIVGSDDPALQP